MTTIYLVRHAHSTYSTDEEARPLSEQGRDDAEQLTTLFDGITLDYIYASPYRRAIETVQPLAEQSGLAIQETAAVQERLLAPGELPDFRQAVRYVWKHPDENPYGGESNVTAQRRIVLEIKRLLEHHQNQTIVIGTHGNIMVLLMQYFDPEYGYDFWNTLKMPAVYKMTFKAKTFLQIEEMCHHD